MTEQRPLDPENAKENQTTENKEAAHKQEKKSFFPKFIIKFVKQIIMKWQISDTINSLMAFFTFLLFLISFYSLRDTREQTKFIDTTINKNLILTQQTLDNTVAANGIALNVIKIDSERFDKENQPYLQIQNVRWAITPIIDNFLEVKFSIVNLGNYPAKILSYQFDLFARVDSPRFNEMHYSKGDTLLVNKYVIRGDSVPTDVSDNQALTMQRFQEYRNTKKSFYVLGIIKYKNLINSNENEYKFKFKIAIQDVFYGVFAYNENEPSKEKRKRK